MWHRTQFTATTRQWIASGATLQSRLEVNAHGRRHKLHKRLGVLWGLSTPLDTAAWTTEVPQIRDGFAGAEDASLVPGSEVAFPRVFLANCPKAQGLWLIGNVSV